MNNRESSWNFFLGASAVCWFVMDQYFWMEKIVYWALVFGLAAVILNFIAFFYVPKRLIEVLVTLAESCWLFGNVSWMFNDFFEIGFFLSLSRFFRFFVFSLLLSALFSTKFGQDAWHSTIARFRRMRAIRS